MAIQPMLFRFIIDFGNLKPDNYSHSPDAQCVFARMLQP